VKAKAHCYGDNIDTDRIIAGKYTKTLNPNDLAAHVLEDLDPKFRDKLKKGDFLVAGHNFGCGSSREQAPLALLTAGVSAVIAKSFSRIFFRNSINIGLRVLVIPEHKIEMGQELEYNSTTGRVRNLSAKISYSCQPLPKIMSEILKSGGLVGYLKARNNYEETCI
tara:strand:+ start:551 stop:1048 length:498 start_codon:yes stop_codon:yes gene_type:complete